MEKTPIPYVFPPPMPRIFLVDAENPRVIQRGSWDRIEDPQADGASYIRSKFKDAQLSLDFQGTSLWIRFKFTPDSGKVKIRIGQTEKIIDLYSPIPKFQYVNVATNLPTKQNKVEITVLEDKSPESMDTYVCVDTFAYRTEEEAIGIHSIEYIDLINTINNINKIIEITNIGSVENLEVIKKIADAPFIANLSTVMNGTFETGNLAGWADPAGVAIVTTNHADHTRGSRYCCQLKASTTGIFQFFTPPIQIENIIDSAVRVLAENPATETLEIRFYLTDGSDLAFSISMAGRLANSWYSENIAEKLIGLIQMFPDLIGKRFYAIRFRNSGTTDGLHIDDFVLSVYMGNKDWQSTLRDRAATVSAGSDGDTPSAGIVPVASGQPICISLTYSADALMMSTTTKFFIVINWLASDFTTISTTLLEPPNLPSPTPNPYIKWLTPPANAVYMQIRARLRNRETATRTIYLKNVKVQPTPNELHYRPSWIDGSEITAPAAGTTLVSHTIPSTLRGRLLGIHISCPEANEFQLGLFDGTTFTPKKRFATTSASIIFIRDEQPLIDDIPENVQIQIRNVSAGSAGKVYQASLLVAYD